MPPSAPAPELPTAPDAEARSAGAAAPERLLALMQAGDLAALDLLARNYGDRLAAVARRCCRNEADAEDAVQQALLQAEKAMTGFRGEGSAVAWLSTLVARSCYRLNNAAQRATPADGLEEIAACTCDDDDPAAVLEQRQLGAALGEALMRVPRADRLAFLLSAEGWTGPQIAAHFGLTHDAVRGRLKRARKILRGGLADTPWAAGGTLLRD